MRKIYVAILTLSHVIELRGVIYGNEAPFTHSVECFSSEEAQFRGAKFAEELLESGAIDTTWGHTVTIDVQTACRVQREFP